MLNDQTIRHLINNHQLITHYKDLETQLQPSGLEPDPEGWYSLPQGAYKVVYNETVKMPLDIAAIARTRSTLLRNGAALATAVWDPGYHGRSSSLLTVHNPHGTRLKRDARIAQLIFFHTLEVEKGYSGVYQNERVDT